jgi:hypothetical protein
MAKGRRAPIPPHPQAPADFTKLLGLGAEPEARTGDRPGSALEVVLAFPKLGLSSFGGPIVAATVIGSGIHRPA